MRLRELLDDSRLTRRLEESMATGDLPLERLLAPLEPAVPSGPRVLELLTRFEHEVPRLLLPGGPEVWSLGAALGDGEVGLLQALRRGGRRPRYRPVSPSRSLLERAGSAALAAGFQTEGTRADLGDPGDWDLLKALPGGSSRLVLALGGMMGRIDAVAFAAELRRLLRRGDHVLIDAELSSSQADEEASGASLAERASRALVGLGVAGDAVVVQTRRHDDERLRGLVILTAEAWFGTGAVLGGVEVAAGTRLRIARQVRVLPDALRLLLGGVAALDVVRCETEAGSGLWLARPSA